MRAGRDIVGWVCAIALTVSISGLREADAQWIGNDSGLCPNGTWVPSGPYGGMMCVPNQVQQPQQPLCPAGTTYCANTHQCCNPGFYCSHYGCTPQGAVECGNYYCQQGQRCASAHRACLTSNDTDCGGYHCSNGEKCGSHRNCLPRSAVDCGANSNIYCHEGSKCSRDGKRCLNQDAVDCGSYNCNAGQKCGSGNQCLNRDHVDCGGGRSCPAGYLCIQGGAQCRTPQQLADERAAEEQKKREEIARREREAEERKQAEIRRIEEQREAARRAEEERRREIARQKEEEQRRVAEQKKKEEEARQAEIKKAEERREAARRAEEERQREIARQKEEEKRRIIEQRQKAEEAEQLARRKKEDEERRRQAILLRENYEKEEKRKATKLKEDQRQLDAAKSPPEKAQPDKPATAKTQAETEQKNQQEAARAKELLYPSGSKLDSEMEKYRQRNLASNSNQPLKALQDDATSRREAAVGRLSQALGVNDIRDPKELAKLALDRTAKQIAPELYSKIQTAKDLANDSATLAKSLRSGKLDPDAQKVLQDNGLKLADAIIKKNGIKDIDVAKLKSVADVTAQTGTYLEQLNEKYAAANAKAQAYRDLSNAADNARSALIRLRAADTPAKKIAAEKSFEEAKQQLAYKKQFVDLAESNDKNIKPDATPLISAMGKLTEQALEPHLDPLSKTALAISKEAANDLTTMAFKIETTNAVTRADTNLANSIQAALDAKKLRDTAGSGAQRLIAEKQYETAIKDVRAKQQEAETSRAVDYMTRVLPEDSVVGTFGDLVAPQQFNQYERNRQ
jgi:hypothetical protein